jgi:DNA-binding transcriptional regulator GbsR (MarR family)
MESPSNLKSLSQTLALKKAEDANAVASATAHELKKLGDDLQRQSSVVLTTTALSITQTAAREMQSAGEQLSPQIEQIRQNLSQQLNQTQEQISPEIARMHRDVSEKLAQMQAQLDQQLQPLSERDMQARMTQLQGQINQQTRPLAEALAALKEDSQALASMTARSWVKPAAISLAVLLSISVPAWGLIHYLASQVQVNLALIQQQERALQQLQAKTWGIELQEDQTGRYLILPPGLKPETGWKFGNRQAVKLGKN